MYCGECGTESTDQASFCPVCGHDLTLQRAQSARPDVAVSSTDDVPRSGFWRRFAAHAIDVAIVWFAIESILTVVTGSLFYGSYGLIFGGWVLVPNFIFTPLVSQSYNILLGGLDGLGWEDVFRVENAIPLAAILAYYVAGTTIWGRTLGKAALGIRVVGPDGTPPGIGRTIVRETVGKFLSGIFWIGFLMAAGRQKRALHDRISGTKVEISPTNWRKRGNLNQRMHDDL